MNESRRGLAHGVAAYSLWGIAPLFWKLFPRVGPAEIIAHRLVWGVVAFAILAWLGGAVGAVRTALADRRTLAMMLISGVLLTANWSTFIGAVITGHIIDASLGYFINPLISVALGTLVLRERMRPLQWTAMALAVVGVILRTWSLGRLPWIAVVLSMTFAAYGLVRKTAKVDSLAGSTIETAMLAPIAVGYLAWLAGHGDGLLGHAGFAIHLLVLSTGVVTAVPLLLFTSAARRLPLSTLGFLQFLAPTAQLALAIVLYDEPFDPGQLIAFGFIWLGLAAFSVDLVQRTRPARAGVAAPDPALSRIAR